MTALRCTGKTRALQAADAGTLSTVGQARLRSHLVNCPTCQRQAKGLARYGATIAEARSQAVPHIEPQRLLGALERGLKVRHDRGPAVEPRNLRQSRSWIVATVLAASVVLALWVAQPSAMAPSANLPLDATPRDLEGVHGSSAQYIHRVALMGNAQWMAKAGEPCSTQLDHWNDRGGEGYVVVTGPDSALDLQLDDGTQLRLGAETRLAVHRLRRHEVLLELIEGALFQSVPRREIGASYRVDFGNHSARVHGTRFWVHHGPGGDSVTVQEGRVEVTQAGQSTRILTANQHWHQQGSVALAMPLAAPLPELPAAATLWAQGLDIQLPRWPSARVVGINGHRYPYGAPLRMRVPPERAVELQVERQDSTVLKARWLPTSGEHTLSEARLNELLGLSAEPSASTAAPGALSAQVLQRALSGAHKDFQRCYEQALRRGFDGTPRLHLRAELSARGRIATATVRGRPTDAPFRRCLVTAARRLQFPPPGGALAFEVPLRFRTRSASP